MQSKARTACRQSRSRVRPEVRVLRRARARRPVAPNELLTLARSVAAERALSHSLRLCTVDDVIAAMEEHGVDGSALGPLLGNVFRGREWSAMPWRVKRAGWRRRLRPIRIWQLTGERSSAWIHEAEVGSFELGGARARRG